jgi:hypothetical protein
MLLFFVNSIRTHLMNYRSPRCSPASSPMPRPLLPPKGVFTPTYMIYNPSLPPPLLQTWFQLRGLAWGRTVTPCIPFKEMAAIIGKSPATLYRHMSQLRNLAALSWRTTGSGSLIVSFSQQTAEPASTDTDASTLCAKERGSVLSSLEALLPVHNSQNRESPSQSLIPSESPNLSLIPEGDPEFPESGLILRDEVENQTEGEFEGEREIAGDDAGVLEPLAQQVPHMGGSQPTPDLNIELDLGSDTETLHAAPVDIYRFLVHLTPTPAQRRILVARVTNLPLWQHTLEHWLGHGWNPRNLTGMLELYHRGGPQACRYCLKHHSAEGQRETSLQHSLAALQALHHKHSSPPEQGS